MGVSNIDEHEAPLEEIQAELDAKCELLEKYQQLLLENHYAIVSTYELVAKEYRSKSYRISLLLRRVRLQFIMGSWADRRDFFRWIWAKIRKTTGGRPLHMYDNLFSLVESLGQRVEENSQFIRIFQNQRLTGAVCKSSRQFFIFAGVPFYDVGGGQRSAQLANALNAMGYEVYYIYGFESGESKRAAMYLPASKHLYIDRYSLKDLKADIREGAVFIFEMPYEKFIPYLDFANDGGYTTVYEHIDNWDSSLGAMFYQRENFQHFIHSAQHVTVTAKVLGEKIEETGRTDYMYSPNAVDSSLFEPIRRYQKPSDLVIGKRTLLYFGSLWGEWFDWDLLIYVAKHVDCSINLIGDCQPIADRIKKLPRNFHFLGIKKHEDLPAYLCYSDIALLPFKKSVIGKYVSPLKIFEYIAMNKPVLATPLEDIAGYPNVAFSEDQEEWARTVKQGIKVADSTIFTAENSWYARCNGILDRIGREERDYPTISIVILNRNNMSVIFRCVSSLLTFSSAYRYEIIVVDNDSTDGSYERLQEQFSGRITLIKNNRNGCSSGRNLGVKAATGEMLLFLDSDQWVVGGHYMDAALDLILNNGEMGAVGWAAGWFDPASCTGPIADYLPNRGIPAPWILCRTDIAYLGSGGLLMRRSLFDEIGGFDEFYDPTCFEDTDLSLKIRHAGYELGYCPYMNIMHLPHQTTQSGNARHTKLIARNSKYFMDKWGALDPKLLEYSL